MDLTQTPQIVNGLDWAQAITVFAIIATNLGTVIALYIHNDKKIESNRVELGELIKTNRLEMSELIKTNRQEANEILMSIRDDIKEFHVDMKDFHGQLCTISAKGKK